jgi:hypothetical protein
VRTMTLLVEGSQPEAEVSYELDEQEFVAGTNRLVTLPWTLTVQAPVGSELRILADGVEEFGDLRCQISGEVVPTPGISDYDSNPYPQVECLLLVL